MRTVLIDTLLSLLFLVLQTTIIRFLAVQMIVPDLILLWIVYLAVRRGQIAATTGGFLLGLAFDLLSGPDSMLGLAALSKTAAGFIAGYFYNQNKITQTLGGYQFILITVIASLVHNLLYFVILLQGSGITWSSALLQYGIPTTAYTAALGLLPMFVFARKHLT
jgi:rod shape-determining protein MreD